MGKHVQQQPGHHQQRQSKRHLRHHKRRSQPVLPGFLNSLASPLDHYGLWAVFALVLVAFLWRRMQQPHVEGDIFRRFMVAYFAFRLVCDFLKPDVTVFLRMSSIQWACIIMLFYYAPDMMRWLRPGKAGTEPRESSVGVPSSMEASR